MAELVSSLLIMLTAHVGAPVQDLVALVQIHLTASVPGKAVNDGPSARILDSYMGDQKEFHTLGF